MPVLDLRGQCALGDEARAKSHAAMTAAVPVGRVGRPGDIASAVLLCVANDFMTGAVIDCDGGRRHV